MVKIYISSTYEDLKEQRKIAAEAVRKLGHAPIIMESTPKPLDKCLQDVRSSDLFIGIFAWRYGTIPQGHDKSITHQEYEEAIKEGIPCLIFLLHESAPWPTIWVPEGQERKTIKGLRAHLRENHLISYFSSNKELARAVKKAVKKTLPSGKKLLKTSPKKWYEKWQSRVASIAAILTIVGFALSLPSIVKDLDEAINGSEVERRVDLIEETIAELLKQAIEKKEINYQVFLQEWAKKHNIPFDEAKKQFDSWAKQAQNSKDPRKQTLSDFYLKNFTKPAKLLDKNKKIEEKEQTPSQKPKASQEEKDPEDSGKDHSKDQLTKKTPPNEMREKGEQQKVIPKKTKKKETTSHKKIKEPDSNLSIDPIQEALESLLKQKKTSAAKPGSRKIDYQLFLQQWAKKHKITAEKAKKQFDTWAKQAKNSKGPRKQTLSDFYSKSFTEPAKLPDKNKGQPTLTQNIVPQIAPDLDLTSYKKFKESGDVFYKKNDLTSALKEYQKAERRVTQESVPKQWAEINFDLGLTKRKLGSSPTAKNSVTLLSESRRHNQNALKVYTKKDTPKDWADTQNNLGASLFQLGIRASGNEFLDFLNNSLAAYNKALEVRTKKDMPKDWAKTQYNLGGSLLHLGIKASGEESLDFLNKAVAAYNNVLEVWTKKDMPKGWADTQNNLGASLYELGKRTTGRESIDFLNKAVTRYNNALEIKTKKDMPEAWAHTQNNLGVSLDILGRRTNGKDAMVLFKDSVKAHQKALKIYRKKNMMENWASTQDNLGIVLNDQGSRTQGKKALYLFNKAASAHKKALEVMKKKDMPIDWGKAQFNLGVALYNIGKRTNGSEATVSFKNAVKAYQKAREVYTKKDTPQVWANTQNNFGVALYELGIRATDKESIEFLNRAVTRYNKALEVQTKKDMPQDWARTQNNLELALKEIERRKGESGGG